MSATPGPWHVVSRETRFDICQASGDRYEDKIAELHYWSRPVPKKGQPDRATAEANAILMASAPDTAAERDRLRAALEDAADFMLAKFGSVTNPSSSQAWSDSDAFETYWKTQAALTEGTSRTGR